MGRAIADLTVSTAHTRKEPVTWAGRSDMRTSVTLRARKETAVGWKV
jgi:hypothetical protein